MSSEHIIGSSLSARASKATISRLGMLIRSFPSTGELGPDAVNLVVYAESITQRWSIQSVRCRS